MLVSTEWLQQHLRDPQVVVVDMRWRPDGSGALRYERGHVPGAVFLDWTADIVDPNSPVAFTLAPPERFAAAMQRAGIRDDAAAVAYADDHGSGPFRLWWACRVYGHDQVHVLDGALEKWVAEGRPLETGASAPRLGARWRPQEGASLVATAQDVEQARADPGAVVLDSRPEELFRGEEVWSETGHVPVDPDGIARTPRGEVRGGHVPWAVNVPATELYRQDRTMKPPEELRDLLAEAGVSEETRAITYCNCGLSAATLLFALQRSGVEDVRLYEGSWEEWGRDPTRPVATG